MIPALFGISNDSLNLAVNLLVLFLVVVWIALIWWTYTDAKRRLSDPVLVMTSTAASIFPFIGTVVYSILRPPEFLEDAHEREVETRAAELRLRRLAETSCPRCEHPIELSWLRCPHCQHRLKDPCESCGRPVDPRWSVCPRCEAPVTRPERTPKERDSGRRARRAPQARKPAASQRSSADRQAAAEQRAARQPSKQGGSSAQGARSQPGAPRPAGRQSSSAQGEEASGQRPSERGSRRRPSTAT